MENPIKLIHKFNVDAGFVTKGCNPWLESSFQVEEALEGFNLTHISKLFGSETEDPKELSRLILGSHNKTTAVADVDVLDKACDAVIFAVGTMSKLGLNPNQITKALNVVMQVNNLKLKAKSVDAEGKLEKPQGFVGPEEKLQAILDEVRG